MSPHDPLYMIEARALIEHLDLLTQVLAQRSKRRGELAPAEKACVDEATILAEHIEELRRAAQSVQDDKPVLPGLCRNLLSVLDGLATADPETVDLLLQVRTKIDAVLAIASPGREGDTARE